MSWPTGQDPGLTATATIPTRPMEVTVSVGHLHRLSAIQGLMLAQWRGTVNTARDAFILVEATRTGRLPPVTRRLIDVEKARLIEPGSVFSWSEKQAGIRRWTDNRKWSRKFFLACLFIVFGSRGRESIASRVSGAFLVCKPCQFASLINLSCRGS